MKTQIQNRIRSTLNKYGFDVVRTRNQHNVLSEHLWNVLVTKEIDCIIDVGANAGQYGEFLRELGFEGHIVSFEPVESVYKVLQEKCSRDSKWSCAKLALGDKGEEKTLNVYKSTVFSSFLDANEYSKGIWSSLEDVVPETVSVARLDEVFDELIGGLGCRNFMLKLDTQGYDKVAFDGARDVLSNIAVLQSELSLISVYEGMSNVYDVLNEYHQAGYFISGMYPINRDESLAVIEYDCVMVKR